MNELQNMSLVDFTPDWKVEISGRQLNMKLNVQTQYHKWMPRMIEYGFVEGTDFAVADKKVHNSNCSKLFASTPSKMVELIC